jgi:hypothetical protein
VGHALRHNAFDRVSLDVPWIEVNTTDAYQPGSGESSPSLTGQADYGLPAQAALPNCSCPNALDGSKHSQARE